MQYSHDEYVQARKRMHQLAARAKGVTTSLPSAESEDGRDPSSGDGSTVADPSATVAAVTQSITSLAAAAKALESIEVERAKAEEDFEHSVRTAGRPTVALAHQKLFGR